MDQPRPGKVVKSPADRFARLFADLSEENVTSQLDQVYAPDAYLNDTLKEVRGREDIREYFLETARSVEECRVLIEDVVRSGDDYYLRWEMTIRSKKLKKGRPLVSQGVSLLRFNDEDEVVYHRDFWDSTSGLFEHFPILGTVLRFLKNRL